jgi:hypothetical protein
VEPVIQCDEGEAERAWAGAESALPLTGWLSAPRRARSLVCQVLPPVLRTALQGNRTRALKGTPPPPPPPSPPSPPPPLLLRLRLPALFRRVRAHTQVFICPRHKCYACKNKKGERRGPLLQCVRCVQSYHKQVLCPAARCPPPAPTPRQCMPPSDFLLGKRLFICEDHVPLVGCALLCRAVPFHAFATDAAPSAPANDLRLPPAHWCG